MSASHVCAPAPSPLLALVCLAVVQRLRRVWNALGSGSGGTLDLRDVVIAA